VKYRRTPREKKVSLCFRSRFQGRFFLVRYPVRDARKRRWIRGFVRNCTIFAFGRLQSSLPKALKPLFAPTPLDFIEIGYLKASSDTFADY
jgi:hypothetical protein